MIATYVNTGSIPCVEEPKCIESLAAPRDARQKEIQIIAEVGTSSKTPPFAMRNGLDVAKRSYFDIFVRGGISGSGWEELPLTHDRLAPLTDLELLVDRVEHKFINREYDFPEIISSEGCILIASHLISNTEISVKEGLQVKPRKISQKEAYEISQKTRESFRKKWESYAQEEATRLYLFEGDDD